LRLDWRIVLKAFLGFLAGLLLWVLLSPLYNRGIANLAERSLRLFERPSVTRLEPDGNYVTINRSDFDPRSKRPGLPLHDLTFNFILMTSLFAASRRIFTDRNVGGFVAASIVMMLTHVFALIAAVMKIYVSQLGLWSTIHYSTIARNGWGVANSAYRVVLMYAIAFALWWIFRDPNAEEAPVKKKSPGAKKRRK
jgi:hypothetical protein